MDKVKVSQEIAEAVEALKKGDTLAEIFNWVTADYDVCNNNIRVLKEWNVVGDDEGEGLMKLLIGYYEVEQTPEENIAELYQKYIKSSINFEKDFANGMKYAIDTLNIKIEGVNA